MFVFESGLSSALVDSGNIIAFIEEERLSRKKDGLSHGLSRQWCIDIAHKLGEEPLVPQFTEESKEAAFTADTPLLNSNEDLAEGIDYSKYGDPDTHHLDHAVAAYIQSGYDDASILVIDGKDSVGKHAIGIFEAKNSEVTEVIKYSADYSLGLLYTVGASICGLRPNIGPDEKILYRDTKAGSLMGLATYYNDEVYDNFDYIKVNPNSGELLRSSTPWEYMPEIIKRKFNISAGEFSFRKTLVAAYIQTLFEKSIVSLLNFMQRNLKSKNLIITGGCGLNATMNGKILRSKRWDNFYVPPLCQDAGNLLAVIHRNESYNPKKTIVYNTIHYTIPKGLKKKQVSVKYVADLLNKGEVIAWFEGGSEYGPRALCHRSLLANPRFSWMAYRLNELKHREYWRPFAPVILDTHFDKVFEVGTSYKPVEITTFHKYMLATEVVRRQCRKDYPAIVAPDGTSRPQVLENDSEASPILYKLMKTHNLPVLVNTSLNDKGEPIVETIEEALNFTQPRNIPLIVVQGDTLYQVC